MLINIQFLRFVAAMLVVVYHMAAHVRDSGAEPGWFFALSESCGFAGVDIFFVISGFIMAYTTAEDGGLADSWSFARRRIARIYSGYWPFFLLAVALFAWADPQYLHRSQLLRSAVLWPANDLLIAVSWTLVFEMFFYFVYTLLIAADRHRGPYLMPILFAAIAVFALYSHFVRHAYDPGRLETISLAEYYVMSPYLMEFFAGALVARHLLGQPDGAAWPLLLPGIVLFLAGGRVNLAAFQGNIEQGYYVLYRVAIFGTAAVLIVSGLVRLEQRGRKAAKIFSLWAGGASYAIYLSHTLFLTATQHIGLNRWLAQFGATVVQIAFGAYALLVLLHGIAHYRWIERPLHRQFRSWLRV